MDQLTLNKIDIEAKVGFRPGRYTNANKTFGFLVATLITVGFFLCLHLLPPHIQIHRVVDIFLNRGIIPYFLVLGFCWGIILVWVKARKANAQTKALQFLLSHHIAGWEFSVTAAQRAKAKLLKLVPSPTDFILTHRLYMALTSLATLQQPQAVSGLLTDQADADEAQVEDSYAFIGTLLYIIPVLGFIGTVLGLGDAIGNFGATLAGIGGSDLSNMIPSLKGVTGGLALAFDTTLVALVAALLLQIYASFVRAHESAFLEDCSLFLQQEVIPKLSMGDLEKSETEQG